MMHFIETIPGHIHRTGTGRFQYYAIGPGNLGEPVMEGMGELAQIVASSRSILDLGVREHIYEKAGVVSWGLVPLDPPVDTTGWGT